MGNYCRSSDDNARTICDLITKFYVTFCVDHDLLLAIDCNDLRSAIRIASVIDQPPEIMI